MAGQKRKPQHTGNTPRTIERIAIAAIAAIAARTSGESLAVHAVTIFVIVVVIEELGRRWFFCGQEVTLRDVALGSVGHLRLWCSDARRGKTRRGRGTAARRRRNRKAVAPSHAKRRRVQK